MRLKLVPATLAATVVFTAAILAASFRTVEVYAASTTFYVSPTGSDSNPGTEAQPFKTLASAQQAVRATIASGMNSDATVFIRGGKYFLSSTLSFNEQDSGRNGYEK